MTKQKISAVLLAGLILMSFAGCAEHTGPIKTAPDSTAATDVISDTKSDDEITAEPAAPTESSAAGTSTPETQLPTEKEEGQPESSSSSDIQTESPKPSENKPVQTESSRQPTPAPTELVQPPKTENPKPAPSEPPNSTETKPSVPDSTEVQRLTAQYINEYRSTPMTVLPGLTKVAEYRSRQLIRNFSHDEDLDICTQLQYGEYVDMGKYGYPEDSYYRGFNREAIAKGNWTGTADDVARKIAEGFKNSPSHWKYLSSDEYRYMAVGCTYDKATQKWYCCVCISAENYGG